MPNLIDGGMLSWIYGTMPQYGDWDMVRHNHKGSLICLDSSRSWRADEVSEDYKGRRKNRRQVDPEALERREKVSLFREYLEEDPTLDTCLVPMAEADDILAIHFLHGGFDKVYAVDKDLVQVPGFWRVMRTLREDRVFYELDEAPRHPPKFWPGTRTERDVLLSQVLFGDRSDSIVRLLDRYDRRTLEYLYHHRTPFRAAHALWGDRLIVSLKLLLIPALFLHKDFATLAIDYAQLFDQIESGAYWHPDNFPHVCIPREEGSSDEYLAGGLEDIAE